MLNHKMWAVEKKNWQISYLKNQSKLAEKELEQLKFNTFISTKDERNNSQSTCH